MTFPDSTAAILAGGHELACHGWFHEDCRDARPRDEERELVERCAAAVERVDRRPAEGLAGAVLVARRRRRSA